MRKLLQSLLILLFTAALAHGQESIVSFGEGVSGKLLVPDVEKVDRAVLLLHGWNGSMDEVGDLFADQARALAERGIASLRFDFTGEGERENFVVTSTLASRVGESEAAYEFLKQQVPQARYGVLGFSLGGLTAMAVAGAHPDWFASMVLWSAAEEMRLSGDAAYNEVIRQALDEGRAVYRTWSDITVTREFVLSFVGVNTRSQLSAYPGALLAIRGDKDYLARHDPQWLELAPTQDKAFYLIGGADHIFNVLETPKSSYGARAISATTAWFDRTLD